MSEADYMNDSGEYYAFKDHVEREKKVNHKKDRVYIVISPNYCSHIAIVVAPTKPSAVKKFMDTIFRGVKTSDRSFSARQVTAMRFDELVSKDGVYLIK